MRPCIFSQKVSLQGSVTTPGGSKRFGSFAGRFALVQANGNYSKETIDNFGLLTPDQLRASARKMRVELDNLYKVVPVHLQPVCSEMHTLRHYVQHAKCDRLCTSAGCGGNEPACVRT